MDVDKAIKLASTYFSEYFYVLFKTLVNPSVLYLPPVVSDANENSTVVVRRTVKSSQRLLLSPKLFVYIVISIFLGTTINSLVPGRATEVLPQVALVIILFTWILYGTAVHLSCKLFSGKGQYVETLSVTLQMMSALYVVSSCGAIIVSVFHQNRQAQALLVKIPTFLNTIDPFLHAKVIDPVSSFFIIELALLSFYTPLALRPIHKLTVNKRFLSSVVSFVVFWLFNSALSICLIFMKSGIYGLFEIISPPPP